jgi:hypothetical protein
MNSHYTKQRADSYWVYLLDCTKIRRIYDLISKLLKVVGHDIRTTDCAFNHSNASGKLFAYRYVCNWITFVTPMSQHNIDSGSRH